MKALILAAGLGSRLAPLTDSMPKSLVSVNGKPILFKQIDNLQMNGVEDITIVAGYKADVLEKKVHALYSNVEIINNYDFASTNNMYSAYLGIQKTGTDGFLMMNADVFFDASVITALLECKASNAIVVDVGSYNEESMKVIQKGNRLVAISKQITEKDALGNSIDVYKFGSDGAKAFFDKCYEYIRIKQDLKKWSEVALNDILNEVLFEACPLRGRWFEIDNQDDLKAAEKLFA